MVFGMRIRKSIFSFAFNFDVHPTIMSVGFKLCIALNRALYKYIQRRYSFHTCIYSAESSWFTWFWTAAHTKPWNQVGHTGVPATINSNKNCTHPIKSLTKQLLLKVVFQLDRNRWWQRLLWRVLFYCLFVFLLFFIVSI